MKTLENILYISLYQNHCGHIDHFVDIEFARRPLAVGCSSTYRPTTEVDKRGSEQNRLRSTDPGVLTHSHVELGLNS